MDKTTQLSKDEILDLLKDPTAVLVNMVRGNIAIPGIDSLHKLYPNLSNALTCERICHQLYICRHITLNDKRMEELFEEIDELFKQPRDEPGI